MQTPTTPTDTDSATARELAYSIARLAKGAGRKAEFYSNSVNVWTEDESVLVLFVWSDEESLRQHAPLALVRPKHGNAGSGVPIVEGAKILLDDLA